MYHHLMLNDANTKPALIAGFVFVGAARFELATSCSQSRRDNRATLRPENSSRCKKSKKLREGKQNFTPCHVIF
jgi:hypothetical protein